MLNLKKKRLDYGTLLMPPEGFSLTHAVATTYSLDLYTLLAIPVALFYSKIMDGQFEDQRFDVLESIQQTAGILNVYCQKGKIKVPQNFNWLFAYIEDSIHEITPGNHVSSFHPKIWMLRFNKADKVRYRLMVLSRNLTFDRSWDLAFFLDGVVTQRPYSTNKPLSDFAKYLFKHHRPKDGDKIEKELDCVKFEPVDGFEAIRFHPIGFDGYQVYTNPLEKRHFDRMLIMSPFVDITTMQRIHRNCPGEKVLISREEELQKIPKALFEGYESYFLSRRIVDGEAHEDAEEDELYPQKQQLHAKLFIGEHQHRYYWFLGSANCTDPAFTRNTEFLVEMESEDHQAGPDIMKALLIDDDDTGIFEPYEPIDVPPDEEHEQLRKLLRKLEYDLINTNYIGDLIPRDTTQNFDLSIKVDTKKKYWEKAIRVKIAPLNNEHKGQILNPDAVNQLHFENLSEVELSIFVVVTIEYQGETSASFLVKMQIELPPTRKDKILKNLIGSREKFLNYLSFLLSGDPYAENIVLGNQAGGTGDPKNTAAGRLSHHFPIFEQLMLTASRNPKKLKTIDRLVQRLADEDQEVDQEDSKRIIPQEFFSLWSVFKKVAGLK